MTLSDLTHVVFSVDEVALLFSLINQGEVGKSILQQAYGKISSSSLEDRLTAASHSLLARGHVSLTDNNILVLDPDIESLLFPLIKFSNILQVTVNENQKSGPEIRNVYLGTKADFTALQIRNGVIYDFTYGNVGWLVEFVAGWLDLPQTNPFEMDLQRNHPLVPMEKYAELSTKPFPQALKGIQQMGYSGQLAETFTQDSCAPLKRGTVVLTDINSENFQNKDTSEAGAGFLFVVGRKHGWLLKFSAANDRAMATVLPGTTQQAIVEITKILGQ